MKRKKRQRQPMGEAKKETERKSVFVPKVVAAHRGS